MTLGMRPARAAKGAASATTLGAPAPTIGASLRKRRGALWGAGEPVGASFGPRAGLRGDLVRTGVDGCARLQFDTGALQVEVSTALLVESVVAGRVHLVGDSLRVEGDALPRTPFGSVAVAGGEAVVSRVGDRLAVATRSGDVRVLAAAGEHVIAVGRCAELESGGWTDAIAAHRSSVILRR